MKPVDAHCLVDLPGTSPQATVETGTVLGVIRDVGTGPVLKNSSLLPESNSLASQRKKYGYVLIPLHMCLV